MSAFDDDRGKAWGGTWDSRTALESHESHEHAGQRPHGDPTQPHAPTPHGFPHDFLGVGKRGVGRGEALRALRNPGTRGGSYGRPTTEEASYAVALGQRLAQLREAAKLSIGQVRRCAGLGSSTLSKVEAGHTRARPSTLWSIVTALADLGAHVDPVVLLDDLLAIGGPCIAAEWEDMSLEEVLEQRRQKATDTGRRTAAPTS